MKTPAETSTYHRSRRDNEKFGGQREATIQRDGEKCVECGMTRAEHKAKFGEDITVDHIDGMGNGVPKELKNNNPSNLQTLCIPCHALKDNLYKKISLEQAINIRHMRYEITAKKIAELYVISYRSVLYILRDERWKTIEKIDAKRPRKDLYMSHPNKVVIKRQVFEPAPIEIVSPFLGISARELSRKTGLDKAYLSRVKNGKTPVTPERYAELVAASEEIDRDMGRESSSSASLTTVLNNSNNSN